MSFQNENIGIMDDGYFVPRADILNWLNDLLQLKLTKIQQLGSGSVYCQVIDVVHPGKISLGKVNWKAKNQYEFVNNFRVLQDGFNKIGIKRYVQVEKLTKARNQDNLEFAQWLKKYYDLNCGDRGNNYLAEERRGSVVPDFSFAEKIVVPKTYNAHGAIIPKKQSPPKKQPIATEQPPKKTVTATVKAPPRQTNTRPVKKEEKKPKKKQNEVEEDHQKEEKYKEEMQEREKQLLLKVKDLEDKLLMITEILHSEEASELKIQMISQIVEIQAKHQTEEEAI